MQVEQALSLEPQQASRRWNLVQLLLLAIAVAATGYIRTAIGPVQEAMRRSLALNDNETALLQGMALALPIVLGAIPVGLLADRSSRLRILSFSFALALLSCALGAFSTNFQLLFASRCLAGLSVSGIAIAAYSMAGDLTAPSARGRATTIMAIGEVGGAPIAFAVGGALLVNVSSLPGTQLLEGKLADWNVALLWMGLLLIPVALLTFLLREPTRTETVVEKPPLKDVWPELWRYRAVAVPLQLGRATLFIADGAVFVWGAPFFARHFHLTADRIGVLLSVPLLIAGLLGPALGGPLVDWCQRHGGPRRAMRSLTVIAFLSAPIGLFTLIPDPNLAAILLGVFLTLGWSIAAAALALTLVVIPGELRGLNIGISSVVGSLFFIGLSPLVVSGLSTLLGGEDRIGEALAIVCGTACLVNGAVFAFSAGSFPEASDLPATNKSQEINEM